MTENIKKIQLYSNQILMKLRREVAAIVPQNWILITCGSFARREASKESDMDYFIIKNNLSEQKNIRPLETIELENQIKQKINFFIPKNHAHGGIFGKIVEHDALLTNIGGECDTNKHISRRILLLLEGEWIFNRNGMLQLRKEILERYIMPTMTDHQLSLFLLNDIIRYYRTMMVDFEFKTMENSNPKAWGTRNIKLVFSRKLLYASGLFSVALTVDRSRDEKIKLLCGLFDLPVIDRLVEICGISKMTPILDSYSSFLSEMSNPSTRDMLEKIGIADRQDPLFRKLKNEGHHFTRELLKLFESTFDSTHPIRRAVLF